MICVSVHEKRRCVKRIYIFLMAEMFYSFEWCFTLFDLPLYSFTSVGVNRSVFPFKGHFTWALLEREGAGNGSSVQFNFGLLSV